MSANVVSGKFTKERKEVFGGQVMLVNTYYMSNKEYYFHTK